MGNSYSDIKGLLSNRLKIPLLGLFNLMIIELVLGGGGRFLEIGPITVRMIFYIVAIVLSIVLIFSSNRISYATSIWVFVFFIILMLAAVLGFFNNAAPDKILEDIKPLSFFFVLPFYSICISTKRDVDNLIKLIKICCIILSVGYIMIVVGLLTGLINFVFLYNVLNGSQEVFFRTDTMFFYKGFIYLCVGYFFFLSSNRFWSRVALLISFLAILFTLTRGLIIMTVIVTLFYFLFMHRNKRTAFAVFISGIVVVLALIPFYLKTFDNRSESDSIRYAQIEQVIKKTNPLNFVIGDGFGKGVPIRPIHMEISFLEIFSKQGIIGLLFWFSIPFYMIIQYIRFYNNREAFTRLTPLLLSVLFIYFQSGTNPYINNPIGMNMILISLVIFSRADKLFLNSVK